MKGERGARKDSANIELFGGLVQAATADAGLDCVIERIDPRDQANEPCIVSLMWIDPGCVALANEGKLDKADMYKTPMMPPSWPSNSRSTTSQRSTS